MNNQEYFQANREAFKRFISNNFQDFKKDHTFFVKSLEYYAHCFGAGIKIDGTEHSIVSASYSAILVSALFGTSLKIPIDSKIWNNWIIEKLGMSFSELSKTA